MDLIVLSACNYNTYSEAFFVYVHGNHIIICIMLWPGAYAGGGGGGGGGCKGFKNPLDLEKNSIFIVFIYAYI